MYKLYLFFNIHSMANSKAAHAVCWKGLEWNSKWDFSWTSNVVHIKYHKPRLSHPCLLAAHRDMSFYHKSRSLQEFTSQQSTGQDHDTLFFTAFWICMCWERNGTKNWVSAFKEHQMLIRKPNLVISLLFARTRPTVFIISLCHF